MSSIISISTAVPAFKHAQSDIGNFFNNLFPFTEEEKKRINIMYERSGIKTRYSVIPDYSSSLDERVFYPSTRNIEPFPSLEQRMDCYHHYAPQLAIDAINKCLKGKLENKEVTHLITVSCTGLSAPGLDIDLMYKLGLNSNIYRTSVNFMGCYAAMHALKQADMICKAEKDAKVLVVCVELCTLHFQKKHDMDNITATLLFADGAAAALICSDEYVADHSLKALQINGFYSEVNYNGRNDMAWQLSGTGFLMTLSSYIPQLLESGIKNLVNNALDKLKTSISDISHWAIHPGGRKILEVATKELGLHKDALNQSYNVLNEYGNMSSPTILFVINKLWNNDIDFSKSEKIFAAGFGPGLTMETMTLQTVFKN
jgi:predicted naringenin-chalcone synthase